MKHTALHLAVFGVLAGAALAAQAADVQIYGRVDAGFFTNIRRVKTPLLRRLAAVHTTESASTSLKISATA